MLHAERGICVGDEPRRSVGTIVVHLAVDDYRTLPFITSQSPYFELFRPSQSEASREAAPGNDVHVAIYGWGLEPVYTSGLSAWPITEALFQRIYDPARRPFWETIALGETTYQVYFTNDRARIYAIGYPILTLFDHLVHLAEVSTLAGAAFVLVLLATATLHADESRAPPRRPGAAARDPRQLLPQAVPGVRARLDHSGPDSGAGDPRLLRRSAAKGHSGGGRPHRFSGAARHRGVRRAPEPRRRRRAAQRRRDGLDQPGDRPGRQYLRRPEPGRDERAGPLRVGPPPDANARRRVSRDRAAAPPELRRRRPARRVPLPHRRHAGPHRRRRDRAES